MVLLIKAMKQERITGMAMQTTNPYFDSVIIATCTIHHFEASQNRDLDMDMPVKYEDKNSKFQFCH